MNKKRIALPKITLVFILYLLSISLLIGSNFPVINLGDRTIYLGTNEVLIVVLLTGILVRYFLRPTKLILFRKLIIPIILFSSYLPISIILFMLINFEKSPLESCLELLRWYEYISIFFIVCIIVKKQSQVQKILSVLFICVLINIVFSIYQAFTFNPFEQRIYGLFISGANRNDISISNPNVIGVLFMGSSLFYFSFALNSQKKFWRCYFLPLLASMVTLILSFSRSALLGFFCGFVVLLLFHRKKIKYIFLTFLFLIIIFSFTYYYSNFLRLRITESIDLYGGSVSAMSILTRITWWRETLKKIPQHLFFGIGYGGYEKYFNHLTPDNYYIEMLASTGVIGFSLLIWMLWKIFINVYNYKVEKYTFFFAFKVAYISSFIAFFVANVFGGLFFNPRLLGLFWLLTGIMFKYQRLHRLSNSHSMSLGIIN